MPKSPALAFLGLAITSVGLLAACTTAVPQSTPTGSPGQPVVPTTSSSTPRPTTPSASNETERDVSGMGAESDYGRVNFFTSSSGNLWCRLSEKEATCWARDYARGAQPTGCDEGGLQNLVYVEKAKARWGCQHDIGGFPFLGDRANEGTKWWDPTFGSKTKDPETGSTLAVLPAGKTLIDADFRCTMGKESVTCTNTRTSHGFVLTKSGAKLR